MLIWDCEEMEEIIASDPEEEGEEGGDIIKKLTLPKLKEMRLWNLAALKSICGGKRAAMVCDSLKSIDIRKCGGIKKLFPSWKLVEYLPSLERIYVEKCEEMEEIIASDPEEGGDIIKKLILPKLKEMTLLYLPALKSICSAKRAVIACDSLEEINISNCGGIRGIFVYLPSPPYLFVSDLDKLDGLFEAQVIAPNSPPPPTPFSSLKTVWIDGCHKRKKLFPSWKLVEYLQSLEKISVWNCEEMEEIIASDPEEDGGNIIKKLILPKLKVLRLWHLPALKSICSRKRAIMVCDSLEKIEIRDCKGLRSIPFYLPLLHNGQPSPPPSLKGIVLDSNSEEWWESLEWNHANAKDVLRPMVQFWRF